MDHEPAIVRPLRVIARTLAAVVVVIWAVLDELLFPLVRPVVTWLSRQRLFELVGATIGRLPPYAVLVLLAVPFVLIEPLKVVALYWMATGALMRGVLLLIFSYVLSIFTLDRIYHSGRSQLMKIIWFERLMAWITGLRDWIFTLAKSTPAWRWAAGLASSARNWFRGLLGPAP